jgi:O-antigen/teichoic acid export membrane protein
MDNIDPQEIRSRAAQGNRLLLMRQVLVQIATFAGGIFLARILSPEEIGLFAIAAFIIGIFGFLGDLGLGASLIQRKDSINDGDLQLTFTLQLILFILLMAPLVALAPCIAALYPGTPPDFPLMIKVMAVSLLLNSWRSISFVQMERRLVFGKPALIETVEALLYQCLAVLLAFKGFGVWSFIWAYLLRSTAGAALAYVFAPWPFRLRLNWFDGRKLLRFGLPYQYQLIINHLTSAVIPALVGIFTGSAAVGLLTWALSLATKPLMLVDIISRVSFPMFSRLQHEQGALDKALTRYLTWVNLVNVLWAAVIICSARELVEIIYTAKWLDAVPALIIFSAAIPFHSFIWLVAVSLNARARLSLVNWITSLRALTYWLSSIALLSLLGYNGVAVSNLVVNILLLALLLYLAGRNYLRLLAEGYWIFLAGFITVISGLAIKKALLYLFNLDTGIMALVMILAVCCCYAVTIYLLAPPWVKNELSIWFEKELARRAKD